MAGSVNKVILVGNLGADPEVRYTPGGQPVANFRIATSENWVDKQGQKQERTEWHRIVAWGKLAELCGEYLAKGRQVFVEGKLQTRQWDDRDGNKRYTTELVANQVSSLERRERDEDAQFGGDDRPSGSTGSGSAGSGPSGGSRPASSAPSGGAPSGAPPSGGEDEFDDLPF